MHLHFIYLILLCFWPIPKSAAVITEIATADPGTALNGHQNPQKKRRFCLKLAKLRTVKPHTFGFISFTCFATGQQVNPLKICFFVCARMLSMKWKLRKLLGSTMHMHTHTYIYIYTLAIIDQYLLTVCISAVLNFMVLMPHHFYHLPRLSRSSARRGWSEKIKKGVGQDETTTSDLWHSIYMHWCGSHNCDKPLPTESNYWIFPLKGEIHNNCLSLWAFLMIFNTIIIHYHHIMSYMAPGCWRLDWGVVSVTAPWSAW